MNKTEKTAFRESVIVVMMGMNGIKFNTNSKKGKSAIKKLNEILPARAVNAPRIIPKRYISIKS